MVKELAKRRCKPCEGDVAPLRGDQIGELMDALHDNWSVSEDATEIRRRFDFPAYSRTLGFANAVAWIAISEGHHPELVVNYGNLEVRFTTHAIGGLSDNDFICAAKVDRLASDAGLE